MRIASLRHCQKHSVTANKIPDPAALTLETRVNGDRRQRAGTRDVILSVQQLIGHVFAFTPLASSDVSAIGTPKDVAHARKPPPWLVPGDAVGISGIGILRNSIVAEPA